MSTLTRRSLHAVPRHLATTPKPAFRRGAAHTDDPNARDGVSAAVAGAKRGDEEAICFLYHRFADTVYSHACRLLRDEHEAEDVTQQVFAKLLTAIGQYEERGLPFAAWILRITHNLAIDQMRRRRQVPCEEVRSLDDAVDDVAQDRRSSLTAALRVLPSDQRDVVVLRHLVGLSPGEIATRMGRSEGAVHGLHHRGRRALRRALVDLNAAPTTWAA